MTVDARRPAVAGAFYEEDPRALARQVEACFTDPRGPGELPARHRSEERHLRAIVVPHAGYRYSGPIAALAFARVAVERPPAHVLVLGVDHQGASEGAALSARDWLTPLGLVPTDPPFGRSLEHPPLRVDEQAHATEHSIEVELPFLQYVLPHPRVVELMVRFDSFPALERVARVVREAVRGRDVLLVASTDFSHYVAAAEAERLDALALGEILHRRPKGLYDTVARHEISMCGVAPTTVLLAALADEPLTVQLLRWGHSGEAERMRSVVGYAALTVESADPIGAGTSAG